MLENKTALVIAPVHIADDVRVYKKQVVSLLESGVRVSMIARAPVGSIDSRVQLDLVPNFNRRAYRFLYLIWLLLKILFTKSDIYIFHNPDTLPLAIVTKALGRFVIYDTHENFRKRILMRTWLPMPLRKSVAFMVYFTEKACSSWFDVVMVTQESLLQDYGKNTILIGNAPVFNDAVNRCGEGEKFNTTEENYALKLVYIGGLSKNRGIDFVIDTLPIINEKFPVRLVLAGHGSEKYIDGLKQRKGWKFVDFHGLVTQSTAFSLVRGGDAGLLLLDNVGDYPETNPNKLFEYLSFGVPVIASNFPRWMKAFPGTPPGYFIPPRNREDFIKVLTSIYEDPSDARDKGSAGFEFIKTSYNWRTEFRKLSDIVDARLER